MLAFDPCKAGSSLSALTRRSQQPESENSSTFFILGNQQTRLSFASVHIKWGQVLRRPRSYRLSYSRDWVIACIHSPESCLGFCRGPKNSALSLKSKGIYGSFENFVHIIFSRCWNLRVIHSLTVRKRKVLQRFQLHRFDSETDFDSSEFPCIHLIEGPIPPDYRSPASKYRISKQAFFFFFLTVGGSWNLD